MNTKIILLLGSNLNDRLQLLKKAKIQIQTKIGRIIKESSVYESEPWGFQDDNIFLNQVIIIDSSQSPGEILSNIHQIEEKLGRKRKKTAEYESRTIDIDILFFGNKIIKTEQLTIPHKQLHKRKFTLLPLQELEPEMIHPVLKKSITELTNDCDDPSAVNRLRKN